MYFELTDRFSVAADLKETWAFFSTAENLPAITPPWLKFQIVSSPAKGLGQDAVLDYRIRWSAVPVRWRTRIIDWSPPHQFIDLQLRGPYTLWHHQHRFADLGGRTECRDRVIYKLPFGPLGTATHAVLVRRQLLEIFRFRRKVINQRLGNINALQSDIEIRAIECARTA